MNMHTHTCIHIHNNHTHTHTHTGPRREDYVPRQNHRAGKSDIQRQPYMNVHIHTHIHTHTHAQVPIEKIMYQDRIVEQEKVVYKDRAVEVPVERVVRYGEIREGEMVATGEARVREVFSVSVCVCVYVHMYLVYVYLYTRMCVP
jgi:hypothetical protein